MPFRLVPPRIQGADLCIHAVMGLLIGRLRLAALSCRLHLVVKTGLPAANEFQGKRSFGGGGKKDLNKTFSREGTGTEG